MGSREGQVTVFIILAVVIVAVGAILYSAYRSPLQDKSPVPPVSQDYLGALKVIAQDCLSKSLQEAVIEAGVRGRINHIDAVNPSEGTVEVFVRDGNPRVPTLSELGLEMASLLDETVPECLNQAVEEKSIPYTFKGGTVKTEVSFSQNLAMAKASIPIQVSVQGQSFQTEWFSASAPVRMQTILASVQELVNAAQDDPKYIDAETLLGLPVQVRIETLGAKTFVYNLYDLETPYEGEPYVYRFAVVYGGKGP